MSTIRIIEQFIYPRKVWEARLARAIVLSECGCTLNDWHVGKRTREATKACRIFAYIADETGLCIPDIAELCVWSTSSVRKALVYMGQDQALRMRAEVIRKQVEEHLR